MLVSAHSATQTLIAALSLHKVSYKPTPHSSYGAGTSNFSNSIIGGLNTFAAQDSRNRDDNAAPCFIEDHSVSDVPNHSFAPYDEGLATVFRYRKQLSVNLGSWFVQENWMNPSIVRCATGPKASELDVATGWGNSGSARAVLEKHWDTWITEDDFAWLQQIGINTVRIPIGYWSLGVPYCRDTPFEAVANIYEQSWPRVLRAISWASKRNIGVLIDLHGAPGSQSGQSHAGTSDGKIGLFNDEENVKKTIEVLTYLTQQLVPVSNVVGIQILNEPQNIATLPNFYDRVIDSLRKVSPEAAHFPFYIHDGFDLERFSGYVGKRQDFVVQDHHSYFVFTPEDSSKPVGDHISNVNSSIMSSLAAASKRARHNLVVDEWSCALSPDSLSKLPDGATQQAARKVFCGAQSSAYLRTTAGWSFWSYKTENCANEDGWCFRKAVGSSLPSKFSVWNDSGNAGQVALHVQSNQDSLDDQMASEQKRMKCFVNNTETHENVPGYSRSSGSSPDGPITGTLPPIDPESNRQDPKVVDTLRHTHPRGGTPYLAVPLSNFSAFVRNIGLRAIGSGSTIARRAAQTKSGDKAQTGKANSLASDSQGYQDGYTAALTFAKFGTSRLGFTT
ncbi:Glucan 1,3-beta-glucosidase 3, partial [Ceratobasidium sp. 423]